MSFEAENNPQNSFGIPGINILPSLSNSFDPYSGINLTAQNTCNHIEVMTLPIGLVGDSGFTICEDPFATNGPVQYGGNGQPGPCYNAGTINARYLGRLRGTNRVDNRINLRHWLNRYGDQTSLNPMEDYFSGVDLADGLPDNEPLTENEWLGKDENGNGEHDYHSRFQMPYRTQENLSSPNIPAAGFWEYYSHNGGHSDSDHPFPGLPNNATTADRNIGEWRSYIRTDEDGMHAFCSNVDDAFAIWIDDGTESGSPLQEIFSSSSTNQDHAGNFYNSWETFLEANRNYRVYIRWWMHGSPQRLRIKMWKPSEMPYYGYPNTSGTCNSNTWGPDWYLGTEHDDNTFVLQPTFVNPTYEGVEYDFTGGDGVYYPTTDGFFPYADDVTGQFLNNMNCETTVTQELSNFNRMRAVCKDGSYVEMANNGDAGNTILSPFDVIETDTGEFFRTDYVVHTISNTTDDENHETSQMFENLYYGAFTSATQIAVTRIRLLGDFNSSNEYLSTNIGGVGFGNLSSNHQNQTYYNVFNGYRIVNKNDDNSVPVELFASANVNSAAGYYSYRIEITFETQTLVDQADVDTASNDFTYLSGKDACDSINKPNTNLYYLSDEDLRPSLGLFAVENENITKNDFRSKLSDTDDLFNQIAKPNLLANGNGRLVQSYNYHVSSLGGDSFKPRGGWTYVGFDGVGAPITKPRDVELASRYIQSPEYQSIVSGSTPSEDIPSNLQEQIGFGIYGYAGYYPYLQGDTNLDGNNTLDEPYEWASWQVNDECRSWDKCLRFRASSEFWDGGNFPDPTGNNSYFKDILDLAPDNQYRTINQQQKIHGFGQKMIDPYSLLEISFWMKTMDDSLLNPTNLPEVDTSVNVLSPYLSSGANPFTYYSAPSFNSDSEFFEPFNSNLGFVGTTTYRNPWTMLPGSDNSQYGYHQKLYSLRPYENADGTYENNKIHYLHLSWNMFDIMGMSFTYNTDWNVNQNDINYDDCGGGMNNPPEGTSSTGVCTGMTLSNKHDADTPFYGHFRNFLDDMSLINADYVGAAEGYYLLIGGEWMKITSHIGDRILLDATPSGHITSQGFLESDPGYQVDPVYTSPQSENWSRDFRDYLYGFSDAFVGTEFDSGIPVMTFEIERGLFGTEVSEHSNGDTVHVFKMSSGQTIDNLNDFINNLSGNLFEFYYGENGTNVYPYDLPYFDNLVDPPLTSTTALWRVSQPYGFDKDFNVVSAGRDDIIQFGDNGDYESVRPLNMCSYKFKDDVREAAFEDSNGNYANKINKIDISLGVVDGSDLSPQNYFTLYPKILGGDNAESVGNQVGEGDVMGSWGQYLYSDVDISPSGCAQHLFEMTIPGILSKQNNNLTPYVGFLPSTYSNQIYTSGPKTGKNIFNTDDYMIINMGLATHPNDAVTEYYSNSNNSSDENPGITPVTGTPIMMKGYHGYYDGIDREWPDLFFNKYVVIHKSSAMEVGANEFIPRLSTFNATNNIQTAATGLPYEGFGEYNSITSKKISKAGKHSYRFGSSNKFKNTTLNTWENFSFTFSNNRSIYSDLYFIVQAGNNFQGTVYLDDFQIKSSYEFTPDVDVRKRKSNGTQGLGDLTEYYDFTIDTQKYEDTKAPLEAQFYFYPRYNMLDPLNTDSANDVVYNDFRNGLFYIYNIDWGDGSETEFNKKPEQLENNKMLYHTYETGGIYEIKATMIRMKGDEDGQPLGVIHNKRFTLRININEGDDEEFTYFGSDGFSFIPYKNTLPMVGGYSEESIYYKSIKRNLGILDGSQNIDTKFNSIGDRIKTEKALTKLTEYYNSDLDTISPFQKRRYTSPGQPDPIGYIALTRENTSVPKSCSGPIENTSSDIFVNTTNAPYNPTQCCSTVFGGFTSDYNSIESYAWPEWVDIAPYHYNLYECHSSGYDLIHSGDRTNTDEFGKSIGDTDVTDIRYFNKPKQMWEMLGFKNTTNTPNWLHPNNPKSSRYWKNIIPEDYSIFNREGVSYVEYNTSPEFLSNLPHPQFREEFDHNRDNSINSVDISYWLLNGRPDIMENIEPYVLGTETPPEYYIFNEPQYSCQQIDYWIVEDNHWGDSEHCGESLTYVTSQDVDVRITCSSREGINYYYYLDDILTQMNQYEIETADDFCNLYPFDFTSAIELKSMTEFHNPSKTIIMNEIVKPLSSSNKYNWLDFNEDIGLGNQYYYPVLPIYNSDGTFMDETYPLNNNILFPLEAPITNENYEDENLIFSLNSNSIESNVLDDTSGNNNYGFVFSDYRPDFDNVTLQPKKVKSMDLIKSSKDRRPY